MEVLENTENDLQIDHRPISCYVITITSHIQKLRTQCITNPLNMGMYVNFPWTFPCALLDPLTPKVFPRFGRIVEPKVQKFVISPQYTFTTETLFVHFETVSFH